MEEKVRIEVKNQVREIIRAIGGILSHHSVARMVKDSESPLSLLVQSCYIPQRFKLPMLESFDGSNDPVDHWQQC